MKTNFALRGLAIAMSAMMISQAVPAAVFADVATPTLENCVAQGHELTGTWNWSDDHSSATLTTITCATDTTASYTNGIDFNGTATVKGNPATECGESGEYTATVTVDGKTFTDSKTVENEIASDHEYTISSDWDFYNLITGTDHITITLSCENKGCEFEESVTAKVEEVTQENACVKKGVSGYLVSCTYKGENLEFYVVYLNGNFTISNDFDNAPYQHVMVKSKEDYVAPTCTTDGSYYLVEKCAKCDYVASKTKVTADRDDSLKAKGHRASKAVRENEVAATYDKTGSYNTVVYCADCGAVLSNTAVVVPKLDKHANYVALCQMKSCNSKTFKKYALKKKAKTYQLHSYTNDHAKLTYTKVSGSNKITVSPEGKVTVKKGTKKGTYKVTVYVTSAESLYYNAGASTTATFTVKVK